MESDSELIGKGPCDKCGSSDARCTYTDGHSFCFACPKDEAWQGGEGAVPHHSKTGKRMSGDLIEGGEVLALKARGITEATCRKFGYRVAKLSDGRTVQVAPYYDADRNLIGQKVRPADKDKMFSTGTPTKSLFGMNLWSAGGRKLVITEGEIDAMSVSQVQDNKWPVVSVPNGAEGAAKALKRHLEWVSSFDEVILMFDMDEAGRKATEECASLFEPGKAKIAHLPRKDANECLKAGEVQPIISAIFNAQPWRPDGIITLADVREEAIRPAEMGLPWFLPELTRLTYGRRLGEVIGMGAGTGAGKSDFFTQQAVYDATVLKEKVGLFFLEQPSPETAQRLAGKLRGKAFHIPGEDWTPDELASAIDELEATGNVFLYRHFGQSDWDTIKSRIRFLKITHGVRVIYLDHLTALADPANERESLETVMAEAAGLAQELGLVFIFISHLTTPDGTPHEEGGRVNLRQFKGARAIGFWTHFAFGIERNQTAEDPEERLLTTLRCLKDRYTGRATGAVITLRYDPKTCLLAEHRKAQEDLRDAFSVETDSDDNDPF